MRPSIVIPLAGPGFGSRWNDTELRFCLRSIEQHLSGYGDIFIIGHKPSWLINVHHVHFRDNTKVMAKEGNIFRKVMLAAVLRAVTPDFLFFNDDHFLLQPFDAASFPYHYSGTLQDQAERNDLYGNTVRNTLRLLRWHKDGESPWPLPNYDTHCPILYNSYKFKKLAVANFDIDYGYCIKTLYCDMNDIKGEPYPDLKINTPVQHPSEIHRMIKGRPYFSIGDKATGEPMLKTLQTLYPRKSSYEK